MAHRSGCCRAVGAVALLIAASCAGRADSACSDGAHAIITRAGVLCAEEEGAVAHRALLEQSSQDISPAVVPFPSRSFAVAPRAGTPAHNRISGIASAGAGASLPLGDGSFVLTVAGPLSRGAYHVVIAAARAPGPRPSAASSLAALRSLPGAGYVVEISPDAVVAPGVATASSGAEADLHVDLAPPSSWWGGPASEDCTTGPCPLSDLAARRWARREVGPTLEAAVRSKCPGVATVTAHSTTHRAAGVRVRPAAAAPCATRALAGVGGVVVGVEARRPLRAAQQFSVPVVQSGTTSAVPFHTNGLKGEGESIAVADTGLDATTCFLGGEVAYRHRDADGALGGEANTTYDRVVSYDAYADTEEERNGHGTFVVGTVMGALRDSYSGDITDAAFYNGVSGQAKVWFSDVGRKGSGDRLDPPVDLGSDLFTYAAADRARVFLGAWADDASGYPATARAVDAFVHANPGFFPVFPAGNDGACGTQSVRSPGTAKNALTVGASSASASALLAHCLANDVEGLDSNCEIMQNQQGGALYGEGSLWDSSSRGPTHEGRIKPDVVAPGVAVFAARADAMNEARFANRTQVYPDGQGLHCGTGKCSQWERDARRCKDGDGVIAVGGTSVAAANAAGAALLLREWLIKGYYPNGEADSNLAFTQGEEPSDDRRPPASLMRALMVAGAEDLAGYLPRAGTGFDPAPGPEQGFGRVRGVGGAYFKAKDESGNEDEGAHTLANDGPTFLWLRYSDAVGTGDAQKYCFHLRYRRRETGEQCALLPANATVRATLAWTDPAAAALASDPLVNDLDLSVRFVHDFAETAEPSAKKLRSQFAEDRSFTPWAGSPDAVWASSPLRDLTSLWFLGNGARSRRLRVWGADSTLPAERADVANTVEQVTVHQPRRGYYSVQVQAADVGTGASFAASRVHGVDGGVQSRRAQAQGEPLSGWPLTQRLNVTEPPRQFFSVVVTAHALGDCVPVVEPVDCVEEARPHELAAAAAAAREGAASDEAFRAALLAEMGEAGAASVCPNGCSGATSGTCGNGITAAHVAELARTDPPLTTGTALKNALAAEQTSEHSPRVGLCACSGQRKGADCSATVCPSSCNGRGVCEKGVCQCPFAFSNELKTKGSGWAGTRCKVPKVGADITTSGLTTARVSRQGVASIMLRVALDPENGPLAVLLLPVSSSGKAIGTSAVTVHALGRYGDRDLTAEDTRTAPSVTLETGGRMGNLTTAEAVSTVYSVMVVVDDGSCGGAVEVRVFQGDPDTGLSAAASLRPSWTLGIVAAMGVVLGLRA